MHEKISKKLSQLPDISKEGYKVEEFVYNSYGKTNGRNQPVRYGCVYKNNDNEKYFLFKEENADISSMDFLENCQINGTKVYYGYIPSYPLVKNMIESSRIYLSWIKDSTIFTLIKTDVANISDLLSLSDIFKNQSLIKVFNTVINSKKCFGYIPFFEMIKCVPSKIMQYRLTTVYLIFSYFTEDPKEVLLIFRGNYLHEKHENVFINVEFGFSYEFSREFVSFCKNFKKQDKLYENKSENVNECLYVNPGEKFYVKCKNNETSIEFKGEIEKVAKKIIEKMRDYSCTKETIKLGSLKR